MIELERGIRTTGGASIDIDEARIDRLRERLRGELLRPGDAGYDEARRVWNGMIDRYPALIVRCAMVADVVRAVNFARRYQVPVSIRGGGHNVAGSAICEGGMVIDMSQMRDIHVDPQARTVRAAAGATWGELDAATQAYGLATPGGEISVTGIAGLTLGGGVGYLRRKYGLSIDNLLSVTMVTAEGKYVRASAEENPELFWGLRGGGVSLGVITSFEYRLHPVGPDVMTLSTFYPLAAAPHILRAWRDFTASAPDEASTAAIIWTLPPIPDLPPELHGQPVIMLDGMYAGNSTAGAELFEPLRTLGTPLLDMSGPTPYTAAQSAMDWAVPDGRYYYWKSLYCRQLDDATIDAMIELGEQRSSPGTLLVLRHMGGAVQRVAAGATAFGNRDAEHMLSVDACWDEPLHSDHHIAWARKAWQQLRAISGGGVYVNFPGFHEEGPHLIRAHSSNYGRLIALKQHYDPQGLFQSR